MSLNLIKISPAYTTVSPPPPLLKHQAHPTCGDSTHSNRSRYTWQQTPSTAKISLGEGPCGRDGSCFLSKSLLRPNSGEILSEKSARAPMLYLVSPLYFPHPPLLCFPRAASWRACDKLVETTTSPACTPEAHPAAFGSGSPKNIRTSCVLLSWSYHHRSSAHLIPLTILEIAFFREHQARLVTSSHILASYPHSNNTLSLADRALPTALLSIFFTTR